MIPSFKNGQRYILHIKDNESDNKIIQFQANVKDVLYHDQEIISPEKKYTKKMVTIILDSVETEPDAETVVSIPLEWIIKYEKPPVFPMIAYCFKKCFAKKT